MPRHLSNATTKIKKKEIPRAVLKVPSLKIAYMSADV